MNNYASVPVSKHNSFPSASRAWARISFFIASYGGEFDQGFYNTIMSYEKLAAKNIAAMQAQGISFTAGNCRHWAIELCGSFEVTHSKYKPPVGNTLPQATVLYAILSAMFLK